MQPLVTEIAHLVETACAAPTNAFGYGIWSHHITRVAYHGRRLAPLFQADAEIVELAALLHDYAGIKDAALADDHHLHGPIEAERILSSFGYPPDKIAAVQHCIATHRASVSSGARSPEAECLANADAVAHIEQVPSLLYYVFVKRQMGIDEGIDWVRAKLQRTWKKISPTVQATVRESYEAALCTLDSQIPRL